MYIYVGSITEGHGSLSGKGEGIYCLSFDGNKFERIQTVPCKQPSIIKAYGNRIYTTNEAKDFAGLNGSGGGITCFECDEETGLLTKINDSISYGSRPSYVVRCDDNKHLLVTNHGSHTTVTCHYTKDNNGKWVLDREFDDASVALFELLDDGSIGNLLDLKVVEGSGYWCHGGGQSTSHLHCVQTKGNYVYTANRGADEIEIFDIKNHELHLKNKIQCPYGYAPRHIAIKDEYVVVLYENYPVVSLFKIQEDTLVELDRTSTMYSEYDKEFPTPNYTKAHAEKDEVNTCGMVDKRRAMPSDVHIVDDHVYVSNRWNTKEGSISIFTIQDEKLIQVDYVPLPGKDPRGFTVSKDGKYALVALCDTDLVIAYAINKETGKFIKELDRIECNSPSCVEIK